MRTPIVTAFACLALSGLAACGSGDHPSATDGGGQPALPTSAPPQALPPIFVDPATAEGSTVSVPVSNRIVLTTKNGDVTAWSATIDDPAVLRFVPGRDDGSATFNPGLEPVGTGSTRVALHDAATGPEFVDGRGERVRTPDGIGQLSQRVDPIGQSAQQDSPAWRGAQLVDPLDGHRVDGMPSVSTPGGG